MSGIHKDIALSANRVGGGNGAFATPWATVIIEEQLAIIAHG
jgi:hypothetical protein